MPWGCSGEETAAGAGRRQAGLCSHLVHVAGHLVQAAEGALAGLHGVEQRAEALGRGKGGRGAPRSHGAGGPGQGTLAPGAAGSDSPGRKFTAGSGADGARVQPTRAALPSRP